MDNNAYWKEYYKDRERQEPSTFFEFIKERVTEDDSILEMGAGDGRDTFPLSLRCGGNIAVVEPNNYLPFVNYQSLDDVKMKPTIVYARFFFHAVDEETEDTVLDFCGKNQSKLFAEFRTQEMDGDHERRAVDPPEFIEKLIHRGYRKIELYIGHFSPYKNDDPLLARIIAEYE